MDVVAEHWADDRRVDAHREDERLVAWAAEVAHQAVLTDDWVASIQAVYDPAYGNISVANSRSARAEWTRQYRHRHQ